MWALKIDDKIRNDVSSTLLRELLRESKSIQYLVPDSVAQYLTENEIYTAQSEIQVILEKKHRGSTMWMKTNGVLGHAKSNWVRRISVLYFACALANTRLELKLGKSVSQSAGRIQMMSHHMSKPCETLHCSSDFYGTLLAPVSFHFNSTHNINLVYQPRLDRVYLIP